MPNRMQPHMPHAPIPTRVIVVMGVSGSGKTTTGRRLATTLGWQFRDADEFHPPANIMKMASGQPLDDTDRAPWLAAISAWIDERRASNAPAIVSCSALKQTYREILIGQRPDVALVYLKGSFAQIADRISRRRGHFMPPSLLRSQFGTLEEPRPDEGALVVPIRMPPKRVVERIVAGLNLSPVRRVTPH